MSHFDPGGNQDPLDQDGRLVGGSQTGRLGRNSGIVRCRTGDYKECASLLHTAAGARGSIQSSTEVLLRTRRYSTHLILICEVFSLTLNYVPLSSIRYSV